MKDILRPIAIADTGGTDDDKENEAKCINQEMALATFHLFLRVKSLLTAHFSRCHALTVNNPNTWFTLSACLSPHIAAEERVNVLPYAVIAPGSIIVPDVIPGGKIARQESPLTPRSGAIEYSIQDFTDIDRSLLTRPVLLGDVRCNQFKFLVSQIARIACRDVLINWYIVAARGH